ncbi:right-handed parallel beta-helix repeat-containing protein [Sinirhodobacter populi]|uniref:Right-handed parallel beta-helix repeat-containing protein n=1 Tax=Paenirhodobacter populi TaxID=2306993 RepID=A0A443KA83_9RHOB|nr:glycosyl hydrolase family 28-related protein [Sinirhodobacter populi]RWR29731.1 right-handed parallel beta-helix repeat-containing protein [Sinirhodobacter populi]
MNMAVTDGLALMPPAFEAGLGVWSREDGLPGSATYLGSGTAAVVAADPDFGSCLELVKTLGTEKLRYMGQTPILPGCYLRITARVKAMSGNRPNVRIAGYAVNAAGAHVGGLTEVGSTVTLSDYGRVTTVSAIVGTGARGGVDMVWGTAPAYGHFGLDLIGLNGGVVRIDDIQIEDVTDAFLRTLMDWVDVRDYGAKGDGVTNDRAAFAAADAAANGRSIVVPAGKYYIGSSLTITAPVRFAGTVTMPVSARLILQGSYDFPTYAAAFGNELLGFKKALQALFAYTDHNTLDLKGRRIEVTEPIDVKALAPDITSFSNRRVLRNGQFNIIEGTAWNDTIVTSQATYSTLNPKVLTNVANIANIPIGARVTGTGVGREVYVLAVDVGAGSLTLSQPFYGGSGTQVLTFTRHKYVLDFSGLAKLDRFNIDDVEFLCNGAASCIMLPPSGEMFQIRDCYVVRPKDKGITSIGRGCQDLLVDRCQFLSNEMTVAAPERVSIALNVNANDVKIRESRFVRFRHTMLLAGTGHLIVGSHWFQGDDTTLGPRLPGLVFCQPNVQSAVTGNYIDNSTIEWTNEYAPDPKFGTEYSFGGLTVTGNTFVCIRTTSWFTWFSVKPYGAGHFIHGLNVSGNVFRTVDCTIDRIEAVDTTFATLDNERMRNVRFSGNTFNGVNQLTANPVMVEVNQATAQSVWTVAAGAYLPFAGWARNVESVVSEGPITNSAGARVTGMPFVQVEQGTARRNVTLNWPEPAIGRVQMVLRMDNPN